MARTLLMRAPERALVWPGQVWPRVPNVPLPPPAPAPVTPVGGSQSFTGTNLTGAALGGHRVVTIDASTGGLVYADCTNLAHADAVLGLTTSAIGSGDAGTATQAGEVVEPSWTWIPQTTLFLGAEGQLVAYADLPVGALFVRQVAAALTATRLVVDDEPAIIR